MGLSKHEAHTAGPSPRPEKRGEQANASPKQRQVSVSEHVIVVGHRVAFRLNPPEPSETTFLLRLVAFDLLHLGGHDLMKRPLTDRREHLESAFRSWPQFTSLCPVSLDLASLLQSFAEFQLEGSVSRSAGIFRSSRQQYFGVCIPASYWVERAVERHIKRIERAVEEFNASETSDKEESGAGRAQQHFELIRGSADHRSATIKTAK